MGMQLEPVDQPGAEPKPEALCVRCAAVADCSVWGKNVCHACFRDWHMHAPSFSAKQCVELDTSARYREFTTWWAAQDAVPA